VAEYFCSFDEQFEKDAAGPEENFPQYVFIEPTYMGDHPNDNHPPHNFVNAEQLIAKVYNALRGNEALWESSLLVITYDEHGGYYDHVTPPAAVPPDDKHAEYTFDQYGVRVPTILISPWIDAGVDHTIFDHTSILKYLTDKYGLGPLGRRTAEANSFVTSLRDTPRTDFPAPIIVPDDRSEIDKSKEKKITSNQRQAFPVGNNPLMEIAVGFSQNLHLLGFPHPQKEIHPALDRWEFACKKVFESIEHTKVLKGQGSSS